jgi:hypothetical protein
MCFGVLKRFKNRAISLPRMLRCDLTPGTSLNPELLEEASLDLAHGPDRETFAPVLIALHADLGWKGS